MEIIEIFSIRLMKLLMEKGITQGEFASAVNCSRQSVNFYLSGKRSPDIELAGKMANYLGVSCDYLIGRSDFKDRATGEKTVEEIGMSEECVQFFGGLKLMADGKSVGNKQAYEQLGLDIETEVKPYVMAENKKALSLLNEMISHDKFGLFLQYLKMAKNIQNGEDDIPALQNMICEIQSPHTGKIYGDKEEQTKIMQDFALKISESYLHDCLSDILNN